MLKNRELVYNMWQMCKMYNWDEDGATAISEKTYELVRDFVSEIKFELTEDEIYPETDGCITIDIFQDNIRYIVLEIKENTTRLWCERDSGFVDINGFNLTEQVYINFFTQLCDEIKRR